LVIRPMGSDHCSGHTAFGPNPSIPTTDGRPQGPPLQSHHAGKARDLRGFQNFGNLGGLYFRGNVPVGGDFIASRAKSCPGALHRAGMFRPSGAPIPSNVGANLVFAQGGRTQGSPLQPKWWLGHAVARDRRPPARPSPEGAKHTRPGRSPGDQMPHIVRGEPLGHSWRRPGGPHARCRS
jgi:hypothetical protein